MVHKIAVNIVIICLLKTCPVLWAVENFQKYVFQNCYNVKYVLKKHVLKETAVWICFSW